MSKVLVSYCLTYGHIGAMANAGAEGTRGVGAAVAVKRVLETLPAEIAMVARLRTA